jgi:hypothetical protein
MMGVVVLPTNWRQTRDDRGGGGGGEVGSEWG